MGVFDFFKKSEETVIDSPKEMADTCQQFFNAAMTILAAEAEHRRGNHDAVEKGFGFKLRPDGSSKTAAKDDNNDGNTIDKEGGKRPPNTTSKKNFDDVIEAGAYAVGKASVYAQQAALTCGKAAAKYAAKYAAKAATAALPIAMSAVKATANVAADAATNIATSAFKPQIMVQRVYTEHEKAFERFARMLTANNTYAHVVTQRYGSVNDNVTCIVPPAIASIKFAEVDKFIYIGNEFKAMKIVADIIIIVAKKVTIDKIKGTALIIADELNIRDKCELSDCSHLIVAKDTTFPHENITVVHNWSMYDPSTVIPTIVGIYSAAGIGNEILSIINNPGDFHPGIPDEILNASDTPVSNETIDVTPEIPPVPNIEWPINLEKFSNKTLSAAMLAAGIPPAATKKEMIAQIGTVEQLSKDLYNKIIANLVNGQ